MQRYNMFYQVHKGLRALLYETALQIQHTDFWNIEEATETIAKTRKVIELFEKHAVTEDNFVFPAVEKYEPSVADAFEKEHVKDHELGEDLESVLNCYEQAAVINEKALLAGRIHACFVSFMVFNLEHMAREESLINEILWRYYSDEELLVVTRQILGSIPPAHMLQFSEYMLKGLNTQEIIYWLKEVQVTAPAPVFAALSGIAEKTLAPIRIHALRQGLAQTELVS